MFHFDADESIHEGTKRVYFDLLTLRENRYFLRTNSVTTCVHMYIFVMCVPMSVYRTNNNYR